MRRCVIATMMALGLGLATAPPAAADVLDEVITYYDPDLKPARPIIECAIGGTALQTCASNAGETQLNAHAIDKMNLITDLMLQIDNGNYAAVVTRVGVIAACAWVTFPGKGVVCDTITGQVIKAGTVAVEATYSVGSDVAGALSSTLAAAGKEVVCLITGCSSGGGGTKVTVDAARLWNDCFVPRVREGVLARGGGGPEFARLVSDTIDNGLFPSNSLSGGCFNALLNAVGQPAPSPLPTFSGNAGPFSVVNGPAPNTSPTPMAIAHAKAVQNEVAVQLQSAARPMVDRFRAIVETATVQALEPAADAYRTLQTQWIERASTRAAAWFTAVVPLGLVVSGERRACEEALNTNGAKGISRWADAGAVIGSPTQLKGRTQTDWRLADAPQPWCQAKYVTAFNDSIAARRATYQEALAGGCEKINNDPKRLRCPLLSTALARCVSAFTGTSDGGHCSGYAISLQPTGPITAPPAANPPSSAPPDPPPATRPATPTPQQPVLRPPPRLRIPAPATPMIPRG